MWNYRIVNVDETFEEDQTLEIREVYYDQQNEPYGHCGAEVFGNEIEEIDKLLTTMREAFDYTILTKADFTGDVNRTESLDE